MSRQPSFVSRSINHYKNITSFFKDKKTKYSFIPDNFKTLDQVTAALRESGLQSSNLILGIDFTKSNEWTGKVSFNNQSLHAIGDIPNPYEKAISIIVKTLAPFDDDNLIPCFGFGDATTRDREVFSFHSDHTPCKGFEEVLACYRNVVPNLKLAGPTYFAPVIDAAIDIVEKSGGQYHVLVIIADGQIGESPREEKTIKSIVKASSHPLSIVLIGVGDGPWEDMQRFDDKIPKREFDNFQFINFTAIMSKNTTHAEKEAAFAVAALMEIPIQYKAARDFGILGRTTGKARKIVPRPPPVPYTLPALQHVPSNLPSPAIDDRNQVTAALRESGLESFNLILGIDFTKSNEWTGKVSFNNRSLHAIGNFPNPYEKAISIIGKTFAPFDDNNLIPCFGFGDATTYDQEVFSFHSDHTPCKGFEELLACYRSIVPNLRLAGPTSFASVIDAAIDIVEKSGGQYHVLVIIADGQVSRSVDTSDGELSHQEEKTIQSIVNASSHPLSIVLIGVGDGPWEDMQRFDDKIPAREFDNFQFVNFTAIMSKNTTPAEKEAAFVVAALMEIPIQYKAARDFGILGRTTGKARKIVPRPPLAPYTLRALQHVPSNLPSPAVTAALRESGLESFNLILGIDFTKSNEWTGKVSFNNRSLHAIGNIPNPYEKAISIIGKTFAPFDDNNLIPCFGFGDATTYDQEVFSFHSDHTPCKGFEELLACYRSIVPNLRLAGPTSFVSVIDAAIDIVEKSGGQYHVLVIIADGQVSRSVDTSDGELSHQEEKTIQSIVNASSHPLSIVLIGVGDGPWEDMQRFDDKIPAREFDNFQFVNFTAIMSKNTTPAEKEAAFAVAALMEIPIQYKAARDFGILGRTTGKARKIFPRPPLAPYTLRALRHVPSNLPSPAIDDRNQVTAALREFGLESFNLILGIDFTKSNEWTGKVSFNNRSLHAIGNIPNPYEKAISIIGKTFAPFDDNNLIPCFGFGDATTYDQEVFSFHSDHTPCKGFEELLACYRSIVPNLRLAGPTSFASVIDAAIDIVEKSGGQYHVLVIFADGQVSRSVDTSDGELSHQEEKTIQSIVNASSHPLSIVLIGVGDGPWEDMQRFDDKIPAREFDNFQFVNFTAIMSKNTTPAEKEAAFAVAALMEIPIQYKAARDFGILGRTTGKARKIVPRPPPVPYTLPALQHVPSNLPSPAIDDRNQVTAALRESGLESFNLILGIDFTKSNEWTGKVSFNNRSLHAIGNIPNPYEKAISIIGKTFAPFDDNNLIPCFGFGDATTYDQEVFSFHSDHTPCKGFEELLACYRSIVPNLRLAGPTSFASVIDAAIDIVEKSGGQYHVLVIFADGQVSRSVDTSDGELSHQEEKTIQSIVNASSHPLSIVLIGVGDGPWEDMQRFDDKIPAREFDNFQFVNFTAIMSKNTTPTEKEAAFAVAALLEIPIQYKAARDFGILGRTTGKARKIVPRPPPVPYTLPALQHVPSNLPSPAIDDRNQACPICLTNAKEMAFNCGHMTCRECSTKVYNCPICPQRITTRLRLYENYGDSACFFIRD